MPKPSNPRRVRSEDFPSEYADMIQPLASILNPFMDEIVNILAGRVDFENLKQHVATYEVTVDSDGVPINNNKLRIDYTRIFGLYVINSSNITNVGTYPTSSPSIHYTEDGTQVLTINKINGLQADNKYRLTVLVIPK